MVKKRKLFWCVAAGYTILTFVLNHILNTKVGEFLMQISYFALAGLLIWWIFSFLKFSIKQLIYSDKHK